MPVYWAFAVVMADRTRRAIDEIREGDLVATREGAKKVTAIMRRPYEGDGIRLSLSGVAEDLVSTSDHPVLVLRRHQVHCKLQ